MRPILVLCFWTDHIMLCPIYPPLPSFPSPEGNSGVHTHTRLRVGHGSAAAPVSLCTDSGMVAQHNKTIDCRCGRSVLVEAHHGGGAGSAINEMMRVAGAACLLGFSFQPVGPWPFVPHDACGPGEF